MAGGPASAETTSTAGASMVPGGGSTAAAPARTMWGATEILAILAFVTAWVALALVSQLTPWISIILWLVLGALGVVLTALSERWSRRRKQAILGTFAVLYGLAAAAVVVVTPVSTSGGPAPAPTVTVETAAPSSQ